MVWSDLLAHYKGDVSRATEHVVKRRGHQKGCSTNRNTGEETFLVFADEERTWSTTSIDLQLNC